MDEEIEMILEEAREAMDKSLEYLADELLKIRAGRAAPAMLDSVMVDYYGSSTPLGQTANINTPDARTITVQPWEKGMLDTIEKAIAYANLGLNPQNNGEQIIISVPPLTEERRRDLVKRARAEAEGAGFVVISAAIAVLIIAFIGAAMWVAFNSIWNVAERSPTAWISTLPSGRFITVPVRSRPKAFSFVFLRYHTPCTFPVT